jgi:opacity protein-like surface antigen
MAAGARVTLNLTLILVVALSAAPVWAQPAQGAIVSGTVGATAFESNTNLSFSAAAGYRFNSVFGLGIELTSVPMLELDQPFGFELSSVYRPIDIDDPDGSVTIFTTNLRLEIPTTTRRIVPYATAGGGVASLKESFVINYGFARPATGFAELFPGTIPSDLLPEIQAIFPILPPIPQPVSYSSIAMALTLGGGVSVIVTERFSIDADLRYLRLSGDRDRDLGRFGVGASYRF